MINNKNKIYKGYNRKGKLQYGEIVRSLKILKGKVLLIAFQQIKQAFQFSKNIGDYTC